MPVAPVGTAVRTSHGSQYSLPAHMVNSLQAVEERPGAGCPEPATPLSHPVVQVLTRSHLNNSGLFRSTSLQSPLLQSVRPPAVRGPFRNPRQFFPRSRPHVAAHPQGAVLPITAWGRITSPPPPGPSLGLLPRPPSLSPDPASRHCRPSPLCPPAASCF